MIASDPAGDTGGLDGLSLEYSYDPADDEVRFRITCANLADHSTGPAADFSFQLPNGLDSMDPPGAHWTTPGTPVHKIGYIYADAGGSAPSNYTYNSWPVYIEVASTMEQLCTGCIDVDADVPANQLVYRFDRADIITDTEMGGASATLTVVVNVGHDVGWDDNVTPGAEFTIDMATATPEQAAPRPVTLGPNPTNGPLTLYTHAPSVLTGVEVLDLAGKRVASLPALPAGNGAVQLDLGQALPGLYLLELLYADGTRQQQRVVKQ